MELKILFIEDDDNLRQNLNESLDKEIIAGYAISVEDTGSFEKGIELLEENEYDIVILDLFKDNDVKDEEAGKKVLDEIRKHVFVPVIFYTGHAYKITDLVSEIVGVVSKGDGIEKLISEIERTIDSKLALLKKNINNHIKESLRKYFWETVDTDKRIFIPNKNDFSLGYLLLRRLANSLSKEKIKNLLGDDKIKINTAHPMEFYIYPVNPELEYELGEIINYENEIYIILTPTCDFILRDNGNRKAERALLAKTFKLNEFSECREYMINKSNTKKKQLEKLIKNNSSDRYFFLPGTPFNENLIVDFQNKTTVSYQQLETCTRIAKLDSPFAESMLATFLRYYNRVGFPEIDVDYVFASFK